MGAAYQLWDFRSEADYLTFERLGLEKHEYFQGEVTAMVGARLAHNQIQGNCIGALSVRFGDRNCNTLGSDMRVHVPVLSFYTYSDVVVYCGEPQLLDQHFDTLLNPALLIEVLSPSTRAYDLNEKFARYRAIASLKYYLAVDSVRAHALLHTRSERPSDWELTEFAGVEAVVPLPELGIELPLADAYRRVKFDASNLRVA